MAVSLFRWPRAAIVGGGCHGEVSANDYPNSSQHESQTGCRMASTGPAAKNPGRSPKTRRRAFLAREASELRQTEFIPQGQIFLFVRRVNLQPDRTEAKRLQSWCRASGDSAQSHGDPKGARRRGRPGDVKRPPAFAAGQQAAPDRTLSGQRKARIRAVRGRTASVSIKRSVPLPMRCFRGNRTVARPTSRSTGCVLT